jgi:hypothetical protein
LRSTPVALRRWDERPESAQSRPRGGYSRDNPVSGFQQRRHHVLAGVRQAAEAGPQRLRDGVADDRRDGRAAGRLTDATLLANSLCGKDMRAVPAMPGPPDRLCVGILFQIPRLRPPSNAELLKAGLEFLPDDVRETFGD